MHAFGSVHGCIPLHSAYLGMVFHLDPSGRNYLPILPRGNPKAPRPPPLHSVMDLGQGRKESIDAPPRRTTKSKEDLQSPKDSPPILSPKPEKDPGSSRSKRHLPIAGSGGIIEPLPPGGPSSPKPRGISSSTKRLAARLLIGISFHFLSFQWWPCRQHRRGYASSEQPRPSRRRCSHTGAQEWP